MKKIQDKTGRFPFRLWFEDGELDLLMEYHLAQFGEKVTLIKNPPVPVELFLEKYLQVELNCYADLSESEGPSILGATYFYKDGNSEIKIDKHLTEFADTGENIGR
jgi:hypothetical protein